MGSLVQQWQLTAYTIANLLVTSRIASSRIINSVSCSNHLPFSSDSVRQRILKSYGHLEDVVSFKDKSRQQMIVFQDSSFLDDSLVYNIDEPTSISTHAHDCRSPVGNKSTVFLVITAYGEQGAALLQKPPGHVDFFKRTPENKYYFYRYSPWFYFSCPVNSGCCGMHCCPMETEVVQQQFENHAKSLKRDYYYLSSDTVVQFRNQSYYLTAPNNTLPALQQQCDYRLQIEDRLFSLLNNRFVNQENITVIYFFCLNDQICCQLGCRERKGTTYRVELSFLSFYVVLFSIGLVIVTLLTLCIIFLF